MNPKAPETLTSPYFEKIYQTNPDPWQFETSRYEREKYFASLTALPTPCYQHGFEVGGSIGVLTRLLAGRCHRLLSVDISPTAQRRAQRRCADQPHVEFQIMQFPRERPGQTFDLIVLSEVGYYLSGADLLRAREWIIQALQPGGHLLLVHWTPFVEDYPLSGDEVHECFLEMTPTPLTWVYQARKERHRIDVLSRSL
jgi:SAM-dependent methyltransferase